MVNKQSFPVRLWGFVKSLKLAIGLIISLTIVVTVDIIILAGQWDTTPSSFARRAGEVYSLPWFMVLVFLLLINLSACTIDGVVRKIKSPHKGIGRWASTVFHLGLIIILLGTLATGYYRTVATIKLIQGEAKKVPYNALITKSISYEPGGIMLNLTMRNQEIKWDPAGQIKNVYSWIDFSDGSSSSFAGRKLADLDKFFYKKIYLFPSWYGYAVRFKVSGPEGKTITEVSVPMDTREYDDGFKEFSRPTFKIPELPYIFAFKFYPDFQNHAFLSSASYSAKLARPGLDMEASLNGTTVSRQIIRLGDSVKIQDYTLVFEQVKPWTQLVSFYDPGAVIVFWGIITSLAGLMMLVLLGSRRFTAADF